ncbi:MAG TPA: hypothetical protein V6D11_30555 [Waterburya sp.]|jgi:hypothetical protein
MRRFRLAALGLGAAMMMQLTLGVIASKAEPLPAIRGVKMGNIQYRNSETSPDPKLEQAILRELQGYSPSDPDQYVRYYYNRIDLNNDGKPEVVVYLVGSYSCGTGGCTTLIFTPKGRDYRLVSELTLVHDPILVTSQKTAGWKDLVIRVSGGGVKPQYTRLRFNGRTYPGNPSVQPAVAANSVLTGIAIVADASSSPGTVLRPR